MAGPAALPDDLKFLRAKEICQILGISDVYLYKLCDEGTGPPVVRMGRIFRFNLAAFKEWAATSTSFKRSRKPYKRRWKKRPPGEKRCSPSPSA